MNGFSLDDEAALESPWGTSFPSEDPKPSSAALDTPRDSFATSSRFVEDDADDWGVEDSGHAASDADFLSTLSRPPALAPPSPSSETDDFEDAQDDAAFKTPQLEQENGFEGTGMTASPVEAEANAEGDDFGEFGDFADQDAAQDDDDGFGQFEEGDGFDEPAPLQPVRSRIAAKKPI